MVALSLHVDVGTTEVARDQSRTALSCARLLLLTVFSRSPGALLSYFGRDNC